MANESKMGDWAKDKKEVWARVGDKYGGSEEAFECGTWGSIDWSTEKAWPTISSINKKRKFGWNRHGDTFETCVETFRTFANPGILPKEHVVKASPTSISSPVADIVVKVMNGSLMNSGASETKELGKVDGQSDAKSSLLATA